MKSLPVLTALIGASTIAGPALADGGYYTGAVGPRAAGRGGAFVARADDLTAVSINPAGLAEIDGTTIQVGNQLAYYGYDYTRAPTLDWGHAMNGVAPLVTFDRVSNGTPWQAILPFIGAASRFGLRDWAFAAAVFAPPGISREQFPESGGQRLMMVDREALIVNADVSAAWRFRDLFGVGLTLEWITVPRLDYSLVINANPLAATANPVSGEYDILAQTTGSDWLTFNAIVGGWYRPRPWLELGVAGQVIPANIVTNSNLALAPQKPLNPQDTMRVTSVTTGRNGGSGSDVKITLPLPLMARAGGRYRHLRGAREVFDVEVDVEYESWSRTKAFSLDTNGLVATPMGNLASAPVPLDQIQIAKHWNDVFSVKLGGDFNLVPDRWTLRAGTYYETAVAPAAYANVDFPGGQVFGAAFGGSLFLRRLEIALTYQLRYQPSFSVSEADGRVYQQVPGNSCKAPYTDPYTCNPNYLGQPAPTVNAGTYSSTSHLVSLALIYRYGK
ncbi:MAG TPA: outer membrane protein transport protein [Polyangia bacterium]|nr:outer membrane protein transport protein [Polyangia bacterium]